MLHIWHIMAKSKSNEWANIRIPVELQNQAKEMLKSEEMKKMGFTSVSSMLSYLIRREIDQYK
jgi:hypothetical protein